MAGAEQKRRVAVLGTGSIGMRHLRLLAQCPDVIPMAVPVRADRVVELRRQHWEVCDSLGKAREAGCSDVIVATDTGRHLEDLRHAVILGMNVLMEKPLAANRSGVAEALAAAERDGLQIKTANCMRFEPVVTQMSQWVHARCGQIHSARFWCQSYLPAWRPGRDYRGGYSARKAEGGVLRDLVHELDLALWFLGPVRSVQAVMRNTGRLKIESEECAELILEHESNCSSLVQLDYLTRPPLRGSVVAGIDGVASCDVLAQTVGWIPAEGAPEQVRCPAEADTKYMLQLKAFLDIGAEGAEATTLATGHDGLAAVRVIDAAHQSAQERRTVLMAEMN